jgi:hypothetical protein
MTGSDTRANDVNPSTRREPTYGSILPAALRISSLSDVVALLGLLGGCLYFYNRAYNVVFLASFGLGVGVVPMSLQDAVVDGLEGVVINILYLWVPIATAFLLYSLWVIATRFFEPDKRRLVPTDMPAPATWRAKRRARVQADVTVKTSFMLLVAIIAAPAVLLFGVGLIAVPAELAAERDVTALRAFVADDCVRCASYELGTKTIVGRPVASTADRLFVLGHDERVVPIPLDDLRAVAVARRP